MNIVFMGTPEFALPSLRHLAEDPSHKISAVITQPDRPKGRHLKHTFPPAVKQLAEELGLRVIQAENVNEPQLINELEAMRPDLIVIVAFGQKLSREFLNIPKKDCVNIHASLLPKYRGAAPIIQAIIDGEAETGVTAQRVAYELDSGDIIDKEVVEIGPNDTAGELGQKLSEMAGDLLIKVLNAYERSAVTYTPQQKELACYVTRIKKEDALIDWGKPPEEIHNLVRGMNPRPGAFTFLHADAGGPDKRVIILRTSLSDRQGDAPQPTKPENSSKSVKHGTVLGASDHGIQVAAQGGTLWITELKPEGGHKMTAQEYLRGHRLTEGACFVPRCRNKQP
ncbi:MAG: methionyl-tRNA formyltransferase [Planctomycetota bacterium]|jgi:methionyl-tRNA formyltransferase